MVTCVDSFAVEHITREIKKLIGKKIIATNIRIQAYNSIMYGHFCIEFLHFMLKGKKFI